jgi:hypothetical protein
MKPCGAGAASSAASSGTVVGLGSVLTHILGLWIELLDHRLRVVA